MSSSCFTANCRTGITVCRTVLGVPPLQRTGLAKRTGGVMLQKEFVRKQRTLEATGVVELAQIAEADAGLIWSTAAISFACVLVGIAIGFVLLRAESLVEDGTIKLR